MILHHFQELSSGRPPPREGLVGGPATSVIATPFTPTSGSSSSRPQYSQVAGQSFGITGKGSLAAGLAAPSAEARARADEAIEEGAEIFGGAAPVTPPVVGSAPPTSGDDDIDGVPFTIDELTAAGGDGPARHLDHERARVKRPRQLEASGFSTRAGPSVAASSEALFDERAGAQLRGTFARDKCAFAWCVGPEGARE